MNNIISAKRNSAIFLATLLVLGTISTILPSAQADSYLTGNRYISYEPEPEYTDNNSYEPREYPSYQQEYSSDNSYFKSKDSSNTILKKVKCNNINVNVNGLELDGLPPFFSGLIASETQAEDEYASSYVSDETGYDGSEKSSNDNNNSFKFVCKNNNNNTVVVVNETIPEPETCEECFTTVLGEELNDLIQGTVLFTTLDELCNFIDINFENESQRLFISEYLFTAANEAGILAEKINAILDCLEEIYNVDFPRP